MFRNIHIKIEQQCVKPKNQSYFLPEPGKHQQDRMCLIGQCRHCSVLQADHELLCRGLQKHAQPTRSQGKYPEMLAHQSLAKLCNETESPHVCQSSTMLYTCSVIYLQHIYHNKKETFYISGA